MQAVKIKPAEAAAIMGCSPQFVRIGLQQGKLDIGDAIKMSSIWTYNISAAALARRQGVTVEELEKKNKGAAEMNRRQRKKKDAKGLILIFSCEMVCKQETYANLEQTIQAQLNKGNVIVLPPYLRLEGIAGGSRVKRIKIMKGR